MTTCFMQRILLLAVSITTAAYGQVLDSTWAVTLDWGGLDVAQCAAEWPDSSFLIGGESGTSTNRDARLARLHYDGSTIWSAAYGGPERETCNAVLALNNGFLVAGETASSGSGQTDFWIMRGDMNGDTVWTRTFGQYRNERCYAMCAVDSGFLLAGTTTSNSAGSSQFWLVKISENGDSLWSRTYGGAGTDECYSMQLTWDGIFLAGSTTSWGAGSVDAWLLKTDRNGDSLWSRTYGGANTDVCKTILSPVTGGFALCGYTTSFGAGSYDFWIVRIDDNGDSLWSRTFGGANIDMCYAACTDAMGNIALAGESPRTNGAQNFRITLVNQWGDSVASQKFGGANDDICYSIIAASSRTFLMSGKTYSYPPLNGNFWVLRTSPLPLVPEPAGLTVSRSGNDICLRWQAVYGANGYRILQAASALGPWSIVQISDTNFHCFPAESGFHVFAVTTLQP